MPRTARSRITLALAAAALTTAQLTGCATIVDLAAGRSELHFGAYADAEGNWSSTGVPAWIPTDATDLHVRRTADGKVEVVALTSDSPLPGHCVEGQRRTIAELTADWAPTEFAEVAWTCDQWEVQKTSDGWHGWRSAGSVLDAGPAAGAESPAPEQG